MPKEIRNHYRQLHDALASCSGGDIRDDLSREWFDFLSQDPIHGVVVSEKRSFILDGAAWTTAFARQMVSIRSILDVGCHTGYQTRWLAQALDCQVLGCDRSRPAIQWAIHKSTPSNLSFAEWNYLDGVSIGRLFDLVVCSDATPDHCEDWMIFLNAMSKSLVVGGFLVVIGDLAWLLDDDCPLREQARSVGFGFVVADVIGGWDGDKFDAKLALGLIRGEGSDFPLGLDTIAKAGWEASGFIDYANNANTPAAERTIAFFRSKAAFSLQGLRDA